MRLVNSDIEILRASFRPEKIKVLFIGESAPAGGAFFYKGFGQVYDEFRRALALTIGVEPNFLEAFKRSALFLDDLVLQPVNWLSQSERKGLHNDSIASLATRLREYQPTEVVVFMKAIREPVQLALETVTPGRVFHTVSFPGNGRQAQFRKEMAAILPKLLLSSA